MPSTPPGQPQNRGSLTRGVQGVRSGAHRLPHTCCLPLPSHLNSPACLPICKTGATMELLRALHEKRHPSITHPARCGRSALASPLPSFPPCLHTWSPPSPPSLTTVKMPVMGWDAHRAKSVHRHFLRASHAPQVCDTPAFWQLTA